MANYIHLLAGKMLLGIDEAKYLPEIGLMVDTIEGVKVKANGSSSFYMQQQEGEPLVGIKK
ncbi:hypothetical protein [Algoriphagus sp.]|uniref:hypothetical protein n=1 Tax=Algoriphagus sp. TaxID=1872435 RepID=UPI00329A0CBC